MRQLDGMEMVDGQDPDIFFTQLGELVQDLEVLGEHVSEERLADIVLQGMTSDYELVRFNAHKDPDYGLDEIQFTMRNMFVNEISRGQLKSRSQGQGQAMSLTTAANHGTSKQVRCFGCKELGHLKRDCPTKKTSKGQQSAPSGAEGKKWCSRHRTTSHSDRECRAQQSGQPTSHQDNSGEADVAADYDTSDIAEDMSSGGREATLFSADTAYDSVALHQL